MNSRFVSAQQMIAAAHSQNRWLADELRRLTELEQEHDVEEQKLSSSLEDAWQRFTQAALPKLAKEITDPLAALLRLPDVSSQALGERRQAVLQRAHDTLAAIHANPHFVDREEHLNGLDIRLADLDKYAAPLDESTRDLESEPLFWELIQDGYGAPEYKRAWWQLSYYRQWKHADLIVEAHGARLGVSDFSGIRQKYLQEKQALEAFDAERQELLRAKTAIVDMVADESRWQNIIRDIDTNLLDAARARVKAHLEGLPVDDIFPLLASRPDLILAVKRVEGVKAKTRYMREMFEEYVLRARENLIRMKNKNQRDIVKLARPKHSQKRFGVDDYQRRFKDRTQSYAKRYTRYQDARGRIVGFDDYDRWRVNDVLWWDLMTDGCMDGNFIHEVNHHHSLRAMHSHTANDMSVHARAYDDLQADFS